MLIGIINEKGVNVKGIKLSQTTISKQLQSCRKYGVAFM